MNNLSLPLFYPFEILCGKNLRKGKNYLKVIRMVKSLRKVIGSYWARGKVFRPTVIIAFFVLVIALAFLLTAYITFHEYYRLVFVIMLTILLAGAYKKGYGKPFSPKQRRLILLVSFCLGISIIIFAC